MPQGNTCILVATDHFSKWVKVFAAADHTAITLARVILNEVMAWFGCTYSILAERGKDYESFSQKSVGFLRCKRLEPPLQIHVGMDKWSISTVDC